MKLRNKKTGETIDIKDALRDSDDYPNHYLINGDWEDYEEPKKYWYIYGDGVLSAEDNNDFGANHFKAVGNYFETKEEAEKAVEKLKAFKRLKEQGLRFNGGDDACISYETDIEHWSMQDLQDFKTLFGGEE